MQRGAPLLAARIPKPLRSEFDRYIVSSGRTYSDVIRSALVVYLQQQESNQISSHSKNAVTSCQG